MSVLTGRGNTETAIESFGGVFSMCCITLDLSHLIWVAFRGVTRCPCSLIYTQHYLCVSHVVDSSTSRITNIPTISLSS